MRIFRDSPEARKARLILREAETSGGKACATGTIRLSDEEKLAWIRLIRTEGIGPITFHELIEHLGSASAALEALPELWRRSETSGGRRLCSRDRAEHEWE